MIDLLEVSFDLSVGHGVKVGLGGDIALAMKDKGSNVSILSTEGESAQCKEENEEEKLFHNSISKDSKTDRF